MSNEHPLQRYLQVSGTKVSDFAKIVGTSRQSLFRLMRGQQNASLDLLRRLSDATGGAVTPNDFVLPPAPARVQAQAREEEETAQ